MKERFKTLCCPMSPQQEEGYRLFCAQKILRYSIGFLIIIAAIQLYNIAYVLVYTNGRLQSVPSRVYMRMYVTMLLLTAVGLCLCFFFQKRLPQHVRGVLYFQVVYSVLILAWCAGITVYDQRVSQNISVYLITAMTLSMVACFTPLQAITIYGVFLAVVCGTLPMFQPGQIDNHSSYINLTVMSVMSAFICCYRYYQERRHYLEQQLIEEQNRRLEELACHDSLTRLRNRRFLEEQMEKIYADCIREGKALTVMMLDIDHFKDYNDTYGHLQGDECLRRVAWRLEQELQPQSEYLIRYGGEEFLYLGIGVDRRQAEEKAEMFNRVVREMVIGFSDEDLRTVTISLGICTGLPKQASEWKRDIANADRALYAAKNTGRDRWVSYQKDDEESMTAQ